MHRIVIDLYDHTSDEDAAEFARDIVSTFAPSGRVHVERTSEETPSVVETTFDTAPRIEPLYGGTKDYRVHNARNLGSAIAAVREILPPDREIQNGSSTTEEGVYAVFTKRRRA